MHFAARRTAGFNAGVRRPVARHGAFYFVGDGVGELVHYYLLVEAVPSRAGGKRVFVRLLAAAVLLVVGLDRLPVYLGLQNHVAFVQVRHGKHSEKISVKKKLNVKRPIIQSSVFVCWLYFILRA